MHRFENVFTINGKTPQEVFDYIADPDHGTEWVSAAQEVRAEGEPGVGRKLIVKAGFMGVGIDAEQVVTDYEPGEHYAWSGDKPFHTLFDFRLAPADGGTAVTAVMEVDPGKFFKVGGRLIAGRMEKQFKGDGKKLKQILESR